MDIISVANGVIKANDNVCLIGEDINIKGNVKRLGLAAMLDSEDYYDVVVLNNLNLSEDRLKEVIDNIKFKTDVLVSDFTLDRQGKYSDSVSYETNVMHYYDLSRLVDYLKDYDYIYAHGGRMGKSFIAIYFQKYPFSTKY